MLYTHHLSTCVSAFFLTMLLSLTAVAENKNAGSTQTKDYPWVSVTTPKEAKPGDTISLAIQIKKGQITKQTKLVVGMHLIGANRRRAITAHKSGPFDVPATAATLHNVKITLPKTPAMYWAFPIWLSNNGAWKKSNPHAIEVHVGAKGAVIKPKVNPTTLGLLIPDPQQPGLYTHPNQPLSWKFRLINAKANNLPTELSIDIQEHEGTFRKRLTIPVTNLVSETITLALPNVGFYRMRATAVGKKEIPVYEGGIGVVPTPNAPTADSPWGVMRAVRKPYEAKLAKTLGASWLRHTTWGLQVKDWKPSVTANVADRDFLRIAEEYSEHGINIMADIQMIPRELSSKPNDKSQVGDAGPLYTRVAPKDWDQFEQYVESIVKQTGHLIHHWEIGNEPNLPHHYWAGTAEEFATLVKRAGTAIRRVKPKDQIILSGLTLAPTGPHFLQQMLNYGCGEFMDILSVHSLYSKARSVQDMRNVLKSKNLEDIPVWSTEPKHVLPLKNFAAGIAVNMHFLLINISPVSGGFYNEFQNLCERDGSATRWGVAYAICAKLIGNAKHLKAIPTNTPDGEASLFKRNDTMMLVVSADKGLRGAALKVRITPGQGSVSYTEITGKTTVVSADKLYLMPLDRSGILHNAKNIEVIETVLPEITAEQHGIDVYAKAASLHHGFVQRSDNSRPTYAGVWKKANSTKPIIEFPVDVTEPGTYEVYVSAQWFPHRPTLISPFSFQFDDKPWVAVSPDTVSHHWRKSTRNYLRFSPIANQTAMIPYNDTITRIGLVRHIGKGKHRVKLRLDQPRAHDNHYSMEVEMIVLRQVKDDHE